VEVELLARESQPHQFHSWKSTFCVLLGAVQFDFSVMESTGPRWLSVTGEEIQPGVDADFIGTFSMGYLPACTAQMV